ncbi:MAG: flagellar motor switch protein FliN [Oscillospiraceae bacterium]|nr:flagellar motor switch protein FliN [Oscillospiraceae bacterium]
MSNEINTISAAEEELVVEGFGAVEIDAIGEIENITMGSAATAVSNLLNAKVWITTPQVKVVKAKTLSYQDLAPFVYVKIEYIMGVSGSSVMVLKQSDVQLILNQLMGQPLVVTDDFQFDEMNISAVCEVMNQMMGASATALSELIATPIDISTPVAEVSDSAEGRNFFPTDNPEDPVVKISFDLTIDGIIKSEFISVLSLDLAKTMAGKMMNNYNDALNDAMAAEAAAAEPAPSSSGGGTLSQEEIEALMSGAMSPAPAPTPSSSGGTLSQEEIEALMSGAMSSAPAPEPPPSFGGMMSQEEIEAEMAKMRGEAPPTPAPAPAPVQQVAPQQSYQQPQGYQQPPMQQMPYGYPPQMPYGYPPQQAAPPPMAATNPVKIQNAQLHPFESYSSDTLSHDQADNLKLLMGVPLDVTVEIGSAKRKVKDILDFSQGTIIELERQAGAPVDIIVNGNLIAKGDVVVIEDNFAVRITEIIKSKFLDSLGGKE